MGRTASVERGMHLCLGTRGHAFPAYPFDTFPDSDEAAVDCFLIRAMHVHVGCETAAAGLLVAPDEPRLLSTFEMNSVRAIIKPLAFRLAHMVRYCVACCTW